VGSTVEVGQGAWWITGESDGCYVDSSEAEAPGFMPKGECGLGRIVPMSRNDGVAHTRVCAVVMSCYDRPTAENVVGTGTPDWLNVAHGECPRPSPASEREHAQQIAEHRDGQVVSGARGTTGMRLLVMSEWLQPPGGVTVLIRRAAGFSYPALANLLRGESHDEALVGSPWARAYRLSLASERQPRDRANGASRKRCL